MFILLFYLQALAEVPTAEHQDSSFKVILEESTSVYDRVQSLKSLRPPFSSPQRQMLWSVYFFSRLGVQAEDPDLFERALDLLIQDYRENKADLIGESIAEDMILPLYQATLLHVQRQWGERYPQIEATSWTRRPLGTIRKQELLELIDTEWQRNSISWLESFQTEKGSSSIELFRWLLAQELDAIQKDISPQLATELQEYWSLGNSSFQYSPPEQLSGQTPAALAQKPVIQITKFESYAQFPWRWLLFFGLVGAIIAFRATKFGKLLFGFLSIVAIENTASLFVQPLIETDSYFNFHHWRVVPWKEEAGYLETQGSYSRAQRFQTENTSKRIVILGASSAHGSNHLWEDSFAGILDKETEFEVINLAVGGTTSHGILHLLPYTLELDPDLVILYYGHNEVHQFSQLLEFHQASIQTLWLKNLFWRSSFYSLLYQTLAAETQDSKSQDLIDISAQRSHDNTVALAEWNHYHNISILLQGYQDSGIPTLVLNPPTNYPFAPVDDNFTLVSVSSIAEKQRLIDQSSSATTIHSKIRENNLLLAQRFGVYYLDLDDYFHHGSPDQYSANGLFWDELHPSALGQAWIAEPIIPLLKEL